MDIARLFRHLFFATRWQLQRAFPPAVLESIHRGIAAAEKNHSGQIRFAVEGALHPRQLLAGLSAPARALDVFSQLRIWDTEHNNGVLIYLLLADHAVTIIADRGIHVRAGEATWRGIAKVMEQQYQAGDFEEGSLLGIQLIAAQLRLHFPDSLDGPNELPDEVVLL